MPAVLVTALHIRATGTPAPQGSVSAFAIKKKGAYTGRVGMRSDNPALGDWRWAVQYSAAAAAVQYWRGLSADDIAATGPYVFGPGEPVIYEIMFYIARPKGHYGTGKNAGVLRASAPMWPMGGKHGDDVDKLQRAILDGLQAGGIVADDKQFVGTTGTFKVYADLQPPGADIWVRSVPAGNPAFVLTSRGPEFGDSGRPVVDFATGQNLIDSDGNLAVPCLHIRQGGTMALIFGGRRKSYLKCAVCKREFDLDGEEILT